MFNSYLFCLDCIVYRRNFCDHDFRDLQSDLVGTIPKCQKIMKISLQKSPVQCPPPNGYQIYCVRGLGTCRGYNTVKLCCVIVGLEVCPNLFLFFYRCSCLILFQMVTTSNWHEIMNSVSWHFCLKFLVL